MPVDPSRREEFIEYLLKQHKEDAERIIYRLHGPVARIPFQSPMLTWATTGGVPMGHFCRWYGPEGSGKSLTNWGLIWAAQNFPEIVSQWYEVDIKFLENSGKSLAANKVKREMKELISRFPDGMETCMFDTEQRADLEFARRMGVDTSRVEIIDNNIIEEIIQDASAASEAFHIIIIDSASNAQSVAEATVEPGDYTMGKDASAWKRLRQFRKRMDRHENVLIIVDQVRNAPRLGTARKGQQSDPVAPPNVRFLRHNSSLSIEYDIGKRLYLDKNLMLTDDYEKASSDIRSLGTSGKEPHGLEMRCKVMKNSTGKPFRNSRMRFSFPVADVRTGELLQNVGFDESFELLEIASYFEIIDKSGSRWYPLNEKFERIRKRGSKTDVSWHGDAQARKAIIEDEELRERILTRLRKDMK